MADTTRTKHTADEIRQNHLNSANRSLLAAAKRVVSVTGKRDKLREQAATIDSEHAAAVAILEGARERYRHAHLIANKSEPAEWPDGLDLDALKYGDETDPHDVPDTDDEIDPETGEPFSP